MEEMKHKLKEKDCLSKMTSHTSTISEQNDLFGMGISTNEFTQILVFDELILVPTTNENKLNTLSNSKIKHENYKVRKSSKSTKLHKLKRINKIPCSRKLVRHVIFPNMKQIYFVRNLHVHNHYSVHLKNFYLFIQKSKQSPQIHEIKYYSSFKSYSNDFITILNSKTQQWNNNINMVYNDLNISQLISEFEDIMKFNEKRNNIQASFGFSSQSYTTYKETGVPKPRLLKQTKHKRIIKGMEILSHLCICLKTSCLIEGNVYNNAHRNFHFSSTISSRNLFEGFSIIIQEGHNKLKGHIDQNNCRSNGYNGVIGASFIPNCSNRRYVLLGYSKNVAYHYMKRVMKK